MATIVGLLLLLLQMKACLSHMQMRWPPPLRDQHDPEVSEDRKDYSYTSPLLADGSNFPCKGYHKTPSLQTKQQYQPGATYNLTLDGGTNHKGGSCQISLSSDNGLSFRVLKSIIGGCPSRWQPAVSYNFSIADQTPTGDAILAWTWFNYMGNREMYMNCARINVLPARSEPHARLKGRQEPVWGHLPSIYVANIPTINDCQTLGPGGQPIVPVFPHPGLDVEFGQPGPSVAPEALASALNASSPGGCELGNGLGVARGTAAQRLNAATNFSVTTTLSSAVVDTSPSLVPPNQEQSSHKSQTALNGCQEGTFSCNSEGASFSVCDHGTWIFMGGVAQGTVCQNGSFAAVG